MKEENMLVATNANTLSIFPESQYKTGKGNHSTGFEKDLDDDGDETTPQFITGI